MIKQSLWNISELFCLSLSLSLFSLCLFSLSLSLSLFSTPLSLSVLNEYSEWDSMWPKLLLEEYFTGILGQFGEKNRQKFDNKWIIGSWVKGGLTL